MNFIARTCTLAAICLIASCYNLLAQNTIDGQITDRSDRSPIPGVVVKIANSFAATITGPTGQFHMDKLQGDSVTLEFSHIAYQDTSVRVSLSAGNISLQWSLSPGIYLSKEVNVIATRANDQSAIAYTSISKDELEVVNLGQDLPILLQLQPSVTTTSDAGNGVGYTGLRIRGSDATRVNVTINGIPVNDAESHQVYWVDLPDIAASVDNIQLQRGVGSSTNGPGSFGGSLNMQTTTLQQEAFTELNSFYGSFNTHRNALKFGTGLLHERFALDGRLSIIHSDGYMDRATSNLQSLYLSGGYYGAKQSLRAVVMIGKEKTYQSWYGVPEDSLATNRTFNMAGLYYDRSGQVQYYDNQTDNYKQDYYQFLYARELGHDWLFNAALFYTKGKGYYEEYVQEPMIDGGGLDPDSMTDSIYIQPAHIQQRWLDNDYRGLVWSLQRQFAQVDFTAGGTFSAYNGLHFGEIIWQNYTIIPEEPYRYYQDTASKKDNSVFFKATWNFREGWFLMSDAQLRHVNYTFTGKDTNGNPLPAEAPLTFFNPKVGLTYSPDSRNRWYASASVGQKEPTREDYLASTPKSRPLPERMIDYECGYRFTGNHISTGLNLYCMDYVSQLVLNGSINDVGEYVRESIGDSYRTGVELDATWAPSTHWQVQGNVTISRNRIKNYNDYVYDGASGSTIMITYANTSISFSPEIISGAVLMWKPVKGLSFSLANKYVGQQFLDNTQSDDRALPAYCFQDVRVEWSPVVKKIKSFSLRGAVYNVTDRKYSTNGYTYGGNYYYPQAGINFMGGVTVGF